MLLTKDIEIDGEVYTLRAVEEKDFPLLEESLKQNIEHRKQTNKNT